MSRLIGPGENEVTIFKFRSTGTAELILEAADFVKEELAEGRYPDVVSFEAKDTSYELKFRSTNVFA